MIDEFETLDLRGIVKIEYDDLRDNEQIKKIIIGNTLERIGRGAFRFCEGLKEIKFEEGCKATL